MTSAVYMPILDGLALIRSTRELPGGENIDFVIVSAYTDFTFAKTAIALGVREYLIKPVDRDALLELLNRLQGRRFQRPLSDPRAAVSGYPADAPDQHAGISFSRAAAVPLVDTPQARTAAADSHTDAQITGEQNGYTDIGSFDTTLPVYPVASLPVRDDLHPTIRRALQLIREQYAGHLSQEELAQTLRITPEYFSYLFHRNMGISFTSYLRNYRIAVACQLFYDSRLKTYEVAEKVGYHDAKYFCRVFREVTGQTPTEYQRRYHLQP